MTRGKARTPRTVRKLNIGGGGGSSQPPTGLPSFAKSTLEAYVKASNTGTGDGFGSSVAVDGNTLVVGAPSEDSNATGINGNQANNSASGSGAVYVFTRSNGVWTQQAYLKASNTGVQDHFGTSVALSGETLAVGAPDEDSNAMGINGNQSDNSAENSGAVYIFTRVNGDALSGFHLEDHARYQCQCIQSDSAYPLRYRPGILHRRNQQLQNGRRVTLQITRCQREESEKAHSLLGRIHVGGRSKHVTPETTIHSTTHRIPFLHHPSASRPPTLVGRDNDDGERSTEKILLVT